MRIVLSCARCPATLALPGDDDELLADLADDAGWLQMPARRAPGRWVCPGCVAAVLPTADDDGQDPV